MKLSYLSNHAYGILIIFVFAILAISAIGSNAAYQIVRPVALADEPILQTYLYGEGTAIHKGVDFSVGVGFGDSIYAVADGEVIQVQEGRDDGCEPLHPNPDMRCPAWGNYVLIQHDDRHFDRTEDQMAYVYSLYLHLRQNQVFVEEGDDVNQGDLIAQADDTGNSSGHHLHLQIIVHPEPNQTISPYTLQSQERSRNPELWLDQYPGAGTVVGKVTYTNGNPAGGLLVYGLEKQAGWGYGSNLTYVDGENLNPDDILVENWATTDVTPGTYHITLSNGSDMGWHEVRAGETTYVGLYPVWLPYVRGSGSGWNSTIHVRNNSSSSRAQVNTTYFYNSGTVWGQRTDYIAPNATLTLTPDTYFSGSAIVVSSEDVVVSVLMEHNSPFASTAYVGVEEADTNLFVPLVHRNNYGWNSEISIHNAGAGAQVQVEFTPSTTGNPCTQSQWVAANSTWRLYSSGLSCLGSTFVGSARVTSASPVAVADLQYKTNYASLIGSSSAMDSGNSLYAPLIQNNNYGWTSGFTLQNATGSPRTHFAQYYRPSGSSCRTDSYWVGGYQIAVVNPAPPVGCSGDAVLSARFSSSGAMNAQVNQLIAGGYQASGYPAISSPTTRAIVPYVRKDSTWHTGLQIRNTSASSASVTISYYDNGGGFSGSQNASIPGYGFVTIHPASPATPFYGSAVVESTNGRNLAVVVNHLKIASGASGDVIMTHIAPNR